MGQVSSRGLESLEPRRLMAAGELDPTFGTGGIVDVAGDALSAEVKVLPDGRIVTAERRWTDFQAPRMILIRRFMPDGAPDPTFGSGGTATFTGLSGMNDVTELALAGGKLLVAGRFGIMRLEEDGTLDTSFGGPARGHDDAPAGVALLPGTPNALSVARDGRIGIVGHTGSFAFATVLDNVGRFDERFDEGGTIHWGTNQASTAAFTVTYEGTAGDFLMDGTLVLGGSRRETESMQESFRDEREWVLSQFGRTGDGRGRTGGPPMQEGVADIAAINDVALVASIGPESHSVSVTRYQPTDPANPGVLVTSGAFGTGGVVRVIAGENVTRFQNADVEILPDGRFYVLVRQTGAGRGEALHLARFLADGSPDPTFPGTITIVAEAGSPIDQAELSVSGDDAVILSRVEVAGANGGALRLYRFDGDGGIRLTRNGTLLISGTSGDDAISVTRRFRDGRILAVVNDQARVFLPQLVKRIQIYAHGGDDIVTFGPNVRSGFVDAGIGNDNVTGGDGDDLLLGGDGDDTITGGLGDDSLEGGVGNDHLFGNAGNDYLLGSAGHDVIHGHGGRDMLVGTKGNDRLFGGPGSADFVYGGEGTDAAADDPLDVYSTVEQLLV